MDRETTELSGSYEMIITSSCFKSWTDEENSNNVEDTFEEMGKEVDIVTALDLDSKKTKNTEKNKYEKEQHRISIYIKLHSVRLLFVRIF